MFSFVPSQKHKKESEYSMNDFCSVLCCYDYKETKSLNADISSHSLQTTIQVITISDSKLARLRVAKHSLETSRKLGSSQAFSVLFLIEKSCQSQKLKNQATPRKKQGCLQTWRFPKNPAKCDLKNQPNLFWPICIQSIQFYIQFCLISGNT